jgi:RimJ/RimL family protein N-acetyltransferase
MYVLSLATPSDYLQIKKCMMQAIAESPTAFTLTYKEINEASNTWWNTYINRYFYQDTGRMVTIKLDGQIVAIGGILFNQYIKLNHVAELVWIYVTPNNRKRGLANILIEKLLDIAKEKKCLKVKLSVIESQKVAYTIYLKKGFQVTGILKNEIKINDKYFNLINMEKWIN